MSFKDIKIVLRDLEAVVHQLLASNGVDWNNPTHKMLAFHRLSIEKLPEYQHTESTMLQEPLVAQYDRKMLYVGSGGSAVGMKGFINGFLHWSLDADDQADFNTRFESFQKYFVSGQVTRLQSCYLHNFTSDQPVVELPDSLRVRRLTPQESQLAGTGNENILMPRPKYMLERVTTERIIARSNEDDERELNQQEMEQVFAEMEAAPLSFKKLITCFRGLKESAVFIEGVIFEKYEGYAQYIHGGRSSRPLNANPKIRGNIFQLDDDLLPTIQRFFSLFETKEHKKFTLACRRLSFALEREETDDRILDLCIALEALFLPQSPSELSFRLGLRLGKMHGEDANNALELFDFIKKFYALRSKVAHGASLKNSIDGEATQVEHLLRLSFKKYLNDPEAFTEEAFNTLLLS